MIDTHCHLDFPDFKDDFDQVLANAREAGLTKIVNIGTDLKSSQNSVELASEHDDIFAVIGFHPHDAKHYSDQAEAQLRELANNFKVVAIGEVGLDFYRDNSPRDIQREVFIRQIALAKELGLPLVLHIRDAYEEAIDILIAEEAFKTNVNLHCFLGTKKDATRALDYGFYLSFGGILTFKNSHLPELVKDVPLDRILLETDAPYLTPHPFRGKRNEPARVALVYEKLSEVMQIELKELEEKIDSNAAQFFEFD